MRRLNWLGREAFLAIVDSRPRTVREWQYFAFEVYEVIYSDLPTFYTENPDDESFPSSVRRWYGQIDDRQFVIDVYYDAFPNLCQVRIPYSDVCEYAWQTLLDLQLLPCSIQASQSVGISNDSGLRIRTVFRRDDRGFDSPIYNGTSETDAQTLIRFLRSQNSAIGYSLGEPEPDVNWVVIEFVGHSRIHRARYHCRTSALGVGCEMSRGSENEFVVHSESPDRDPRRFWIRNGGVTKLA